MKIRERRRRSLFLGLLGLLVLAVGANSHAEQPPLTGFVESIEIETINVFNVEKSDRRAWAYRLLNALHRPNLTRERTIRSLLTIQEGDPCTWDRIEEAERVLRAQKFIQDVWISAVPLEGGGCRLHVPVQDAWSTRLGASFGNEGGQSRYKLKVSETNLLGTGQRFDWTRRHDQDRTESQLLLSSPALFGSRWQSTLAFSDNSDGREQRFSLARPFWSLQERWSTEFAIHGLESEERVYVAGEAVDHWLNDSRTFYAAYSRAPKGLDGDRLFTWKLAVEGDRKTWSPVDEFAPSSRPDLRPYDRDLVLAVGELSWRRVDFRRVERVTSARRVEDLSLGRELTVGLGLSIPGLSNDNGGRVFFSSSHGFELPRGGYYLVAARQEGTWLRDGWINVFTTLEGQYYRRLSPYQTFAVMTSWKYGVNVEGTERLLLGGDTGLRAYRSRAFAGARSALVSVEHRVFTDWHLTKLFQVGFAAFLDVGSAWEETQGLSAKDLHANLGVGLRLLLNPSGTGTTLHVNASYAFDSPAETGEKRWRFSVLSKRGF